MSQSGQTDHLYLCYTASKLKKRQLQEIMMKMKSWVTEMYEIQFMKVMSISQSDLIANDFLWLKDGAKTYN